MILSEVCFLATWDVGGYVVIGWLGWVGYLGNSLPMAAASYLPTHHSSCSNIDLRTFSDVLSFSFGPNFFPITVAPDR